VFDVDEVDGHAGDVEEGPDVSVDCELGIGEDVEDGAAEDGGER